MSNPLKEAVLARKGDVRVQPVEAFGTTLYVKKLKAREMRDIGAWQVSGDKGIHAQVWWVIGAACDESGARIFDWSDAEHLNECYAGDIMAVAKAVDDFNNGHTSPDDIAKN